MDMKALRNSLGRVPTCVCVVTTVAVDGTPVCMTANSVLPVMSAQPCIIWSLGRSSRSRPAFEAAGRFGVSLLAEHQQAISTQMASPVADRLAGVDWHRGAAIGMPLIVGSMARFECSNIIVREIGDHVAFIGDVVAWDADANLRPLLYVDGRYAAIERMALDAQASRAALAEGLAA
ncbi:flavin reductase family protein [Variovorax sp. PBL-E5]|uniref:flavin reductase family protein n=1 Tax=Variovorax sp. PBL-E5 TaxID=434014 RepID=UPI0013199F59|nr:flavin reductase family protein [Variovorax sp. PBL-E5]VTU45976.1 FMN reductase (NADH) NtaB [Variovorax sp. PBL-E5]